MKRTFAILLLSLGIASAQRLEFAPGGTVKVEKADGNLYVEAWDQPAVEIVGADVKTHRDGNALTVSTPSSKHDEFTIRVPRDSKLEIHHGSGYVLVTGVAGDIEADAKRGDIVLMVPESQKYSVDAKVKLGNVMSDEIGTTHTRYLIGENFLSTTDPAHKLTLRMGIGGITIKALP